MNSFSSEAGQAKNKTMFNQTCDRLREYLKQNGPLGITIPYSSPNTMNLFPTNNAAELEEDDDADDDDHVHNNMTIFYNGQVTMVEDVSRDEANEIIYLASTLSLSSAPSRPAATVSNSVESDLGQFSYAVARDMSQKRSRSLTRFFEKRKERINAGAPYTLRDKSWLGLSLSSAPSK